MIYLELIWVYFKIGIIGFGGGYAMLPLIQEEIVDKHHWLSIEEFTDMVALSQLTPGPIGINSATYVGYTVTNSILGSLCTNIAVCTPAIIILIIAFLFLKKNQTSTWLHFAFLGIRPASVGLILSSILLLSFNPNFILNSFDEAFFVESNFSDYMSIFIFFLTLIIGIKRWLPPIVLLLIAGGLGFCFY